MLILGCKISCTPNYICTPVNIYHLLHLLYNIHMTWPENLPFNEQTPWESAIMLELYQQGVKARADWQDGERKLELAHYIKQLTSGELGASGTPLEECFNPKEIAVVVAFCEAADAVEWNTTLDARLERRRFGYMQLDGSRDPMVAQNGLATWLRTRRGGFEGGLVVIGAGIDADGRTIQIGLTDEHQLRAEVKPAPRIEEPAGPLDENFGSYLPSVLRHSMPVHIDHPNHMFEAYDLKVEGWAPLPPGIVIIPGTWREADMGHDVQGRANWRARQMIFEAAEGDPGDGIHTAGATALSKVLEPHLDTLRPTAGLVTRTFAKNTGKKALQLVRRSK